MCSPLQLNQVFSPYGYVNIMDHQLRKVDGKAQGKKLYKSLRSGKFIMF